LPNRPNPAKLNALQLKTLAILQELARSEGGAAEPLDDGSIALNRLPRPHGDHFHVGAALVMARDATGLGNPAVFNALHRKGLLTRAPDGRPALTAAAITYETGIAEQILHRSDH
jgi:hypothetical protein